LFKDYYKILEVSRNATTDEIKIGYRNLAKKYHPDANIPNFNFNAIMQEINEAYEVLKDDNKRKNYNSQYANELKNSSQKNSSQYANELKNSSQNSDFIIWNGKDIKDFGVKPEGYISYQAFVKAGFVEDEFETVAESEERLAKSGMLNAYFGVQNINMKYTAEKTEFDVSINGFANFKITIQRNIAREFKEQVKSFDFNFDRNLQLDSISVLFNNQLFYGRDFIKDLLKEIIASKTITIGNLMFQDAELPNKMNWNDACKYCENLRLLGFSDWRLPTIEELRIAYQHKSEFRNMQNAPYWSISKHNTSYSWQLNFYFGNEGNYYQGNNFLFRCIRNNQ
jgi:curved DNA-binding protein CbpA